MTRDIKDDVVSFLRDHVDETAISVAFDAQDDIGFAAYDTVDQDVYVTPVSEDPVVLGGGDGQLSGLDADGSGGFQDVITTVQIDCWGGDETTDVYDETATHPDTVANELGREVHRIFFHANETDGSIGIPDGYEWVNAAPPVEANDIEQNPTKYRRLVRARLKHTETT